MALSAMALKNAEKVAASGETNLSSYSQEFRDYVAQLRSAAAPKPQPAPPPQSQPAPVQQAPSQGLNIESTAFYGTPISQVINQPTPQQQQPTVQLSSGSQPISKPAQNDPNLMSQYLQITGSNWGLGRAITKQDVSNAAASAGKPDPYSTQFGGAAPGTGTQTPDQNALLQAYTIIDASNLLTPEQKILFKNAVQGFDPAKDINVTNILDTFKKLRDTSIDPYYQEMAKIAMDDVTRAASNIGASRTLELETEKMNEQQNIENTQADLERRGMTFSGEAIKQLGGQSAYAAAPTAGVGAQFVQQPFGGTPIEGRVIAGNRILRSTTALRHQQNRERLARETEKYLGSTAAAGAVPGIAPIGGVTGTLQEQKQREEGTTLSGLYGQEKQNQAARQKLTFNYTS